MEAIYTKSLITDFPNGLNSSQLVTNITADTSITTQLLRIDTYDDTVSIVFENSLSSDELIELDLVINNYIVAANPNADLFVLGIGCRVEALSLIGASGPGSRGVYFDGTQSGGRGRFSGVLECYIGNCDIGIETNGKNIQNLGGMVDIL